MLHIERLSSGPARVQFCPVNIHSSKLRLRCFRDISDDASRVIFSHKCNEVPGNLFGQERIYIRMYENFYKIYEIRNK
jgi:hypothetical protein